MKRTLATLALLGAGASIVGVPTAAFAAQSGATTTQSNTQGTAQADGHRRGPSEADRKAKATEILTGLVSKGTITQAQADKILAALEAARPQRPANAPGAGTTASTAKASNQAATASPGQQGQRGSRTADTATTGTAATSGAAVKAGRPAPGEHLKAALTTLVSNGTITQAQLDAVVAAFEAARPAHPTGAAPAAGSQPSMRSVSATRA